MAAVTTALADARPARVTGSRASSAATIRPVSASPARQGAVWRGVARQDAQALASVSRCPAKLPLSTVET